MPKVNNDVVDFWYRGKEAKNHKGTLWTDGQKLYSYQLLIGDTCQVANKKVLKDYTAKGHWGFRSQTTSCHVGIARQVADVIS